MKMTLRLTTMVLVLFLAMSGCDMEEEDSPTLIGTWELIKVVDTTGDKTAVLQQNGDFGLQFTQTEYVITFEAADGDDTTQRGSYTIDEIEGRIRLQVTIGGVQIPTTVSVPYEFVNDGQLQVTFDSAILNLIVDSGLKGEVKLTFRKVAD